MARIYLLRQVLMWRRFAAELIRLFSPSSVRHDGNRAAWYSPGPCADPNGSPDMHWLVPTKHYRGLWLRSRDWLQTGAIHRLWAAERLPALNCAQDLWLGRDNAISIAVRSADVLQGLTSQAHTAGLAGLPQNLPSKITTNLLYKNIYSIIWKISSAGYIQRCFFFFFNLFR